MELGSDYSFWVSNTPEQALALLLCLAELRAASWNYKNHFTEMKNNLIIET